MSQARYYVLYEEGISNGNLKVRPLHKATEDEAKNVAAGLAAVNRCNVFLVVAERVLTCRQVVSTQWDEAKLGQQ